MTITIDSKGLSTCLREELASRHRSNPAYSLRAFAKFLEIDHSSLSKILRGEIGIGWKLSNKICARLGRNIDEFILPVDPASSQTHRYIEDTVFAVLASWHSYALLELSRTQDFQQDTGWIAKRLGTTTNIIELTKQRLLDTGMLAIDAEGRWVDLSQGKTSSYLPAKSNAALRKMQQDLLELSREKLDVVPISQRDQSSLILKVNRSQLEEMRNFISRFRRSFDEKFGNIEESDGVYCLSLSLFPMTISD